MRRAPSTVSNVWAQVTGRRTTNIIASRRPCYISKERASRERLLTTSTATDREDTTANVKRTDSRRFTNQHTFINSLKNSSNRAPCLYSLSAATRTFSTDASHSAFGVDSSRGFPSLLISKSVVEAHGGSFAEATAMYLDPDPTAVEELKAMLEKTNTGIVAHYYMDVELQGVLTAVNDSSRIGIADSLKMGDMAVQMASGDAGIKQVICLGVDFMAESVQAILHKNGFSRIPVYRSDARKIGCSLAESAETDVYRAWLQKEGLTVGQPSLHVVYINTSLETKAISSSLVPTITCTSSNVLQTLLQASAQINKLDQKPLKILYGPDTYMGENLVRLLEVVADTWDDAKIAKELHPQHTRDTIRQLRQNLSVFPSGNCVVHHMFGAAVVDTVLRDYSDCFVTAHLEVPGEMFEIAMHKSLTDEGVVGSTSNILHFIQRKVQEAVSATGQPTTKQRLRFILGTEAGMVTSIVKSVQQILVTTHGGGEMEVEIIFPVASEAVTATNDNDSSGLPLVPGVPAGEGCSTAGGCATCPYMKMNDLDAVMNLLTMIDADNQEERLKKHLPPDRLSGRRINGKEATDLGSESILFMRALMKDKQLPAELCERVQKQ